MQAIATEDSKRTDGDVAEREARPCLYRNVLLSFSVMSYCSALVKTCPNRNNLSSPSR